MKSPVRTLLPIGASLFPTLGLLLALSSSTQADTITVINSNDNGAGSLRQALLSANVSDTIAFAPSAFPSNDPISIALLSPLPRIITDGLTIDGSGTGVILDGSGAGSADGLLIDANDVTIRSLQIVNFERDGIDVESSSTDTTIEGNVIGGNGHHGIRVQGEDITSTRILSNFLGTDAGGTAANGNTFSGVSIKDGPSHSLIQGNVIVFNDDHGVTIWGPATSTVVIGNSIGTDAGGSLNMGNHLHGVILRFGAQSNIIGPDNKIAYNGWDGICVEGASTLSNTITQNIITANDDMGIDNVDGGNSELAPPVIMTITDSIVQGQAQPGAIIELFTDPFFEGQRFIASTTADTFGIFTVTLTTPLTAPLFTTTGTDAADNNTSEFSASCGPQGLGSSNIWPYCTIEPSPISSPFGPRQMASQGYRYDFHRGVDLPAPLETPFYAIADGVVTKVVTDPVNLDGTIRLRHTDPMTYYSHYRHVAQSFVITGQTVSKGVLLGSTGQSTSGFEHIHFEIRDEPGGYEKHSINPFERMPYGVTNDYEIEIYQVSIDPTNPSAPTTVMLTVTGPRQELALNRFAVSMNSNERVLDFNNLNRTKTPVPNNADPDVLDNPYQDGICIMPARFNTSSDAYRLTLVFHQMPNQLPYLVTARAADIFSNTTVTKTLLASSELLLTPAVVTATTPASRVVTHTHTLTNASSTTQVYTLTARSAQSWAVTTDPRSVTLPSGAAITFTTSVSVPDDGYVTTGAMDCIVVEILPSRIYSHVREVYLPLILRDWHLP
jgi:murein DD-endopeptidase MepM/ murein hydrolase activator NlpD